MKEFHRYLPISDEVRHRALYVLAGGRAHIPPYTPYPSSTHPRDHDFRWQAGRTLQEYQLLYITRGGGQFESKSAGAHEVRSGTLFALFPGEWHRYNPHIGSGWSEYWVAFQGSVAAQSLADCQLSPATPLLELGSHDQVVEEYLNIIEEMRSEAVGHQQVIAARTFLLLAIVSALNLRQSFEGTEVGRVVERAKCLMLERVDQPINMEDLATTLNVGYSWFRRMFRQYTGLSPAQYHLQLRLNRARELLSTTTLPVALISERLGFDSPEYFARIFKQKSGSSPRDYRAQAQFVPQIHPLLGSE